MESQLKTRLRLHDICSSHEQWTVLLVNRDGISDDQAALIRSSSCGNKRVAVGTGSLYDSLMLTMSTYQRMACQNHRHCTAYRKLGLENCILDFCIGADGCPVFC